jgi:hypothetical protein|tara:strand:- start:368 stop:634 length:267 start_codon:yes stop_codon:yes gene_type:complete
METSILVVLSKFAFFAIAFAIGYVIIWTIAKLSKGKVKVDSFAAINVALYLGLFFNLFMIIEMPLAIITVLVIAIILFSRYRKSKRLI